MSTFDSIKIACLALCHWTTYSRLIMPDYHINEGAIVVQFAHLLKSINPVNGLKFNFEASYQKIGENNGFEVSPLITKPKYADIVVVANDGVYVFEVKIANKKTERGSRSIPTDVKKDVMKLQALQKGIVLDRIRCFTIYITQNSHINTALTYTKDDPIQESMVRKAKRSISAEFDTSPTELKVRLRNLSKSYSSIERLRGDYCYLIELTKK